MTARCFNDSCSATVSEVSTLSGAAYQVDVNLAPAGSLACVDGGLMVDLLNDTPATLAAERACANMLYRGADGQLFAVLPQVIEADSSNTGFSAVPIGADAAAPAAASLDFAHVNDSGCEQLVVLRGQFQLGYEILQPASAVAATAGELIRAGNLTTADTVGPEDAIAMTPFNAQWIARLKRSMAGTLVIAATPVIADHFSTSGLIPDNGEATQAKSEWRNFTWMEQVPAGATIRFTADILHDGPEQTVNIATSPGQDTDPHRGFRVHNCRLHAYPLQVI